MKQLPLAMGLRERAILDSYVAGPNAAIVELLRASATAPTAGGVGRAGDAGAAGSVLPNVPGARTYWLAGPAGVGKTHLLQACCTQALAVGHTAQYLPLSELRSLGPAALAGWQRESVVAVDELALIIGQRDWEHALFNLYREAEQHQVLLLLAAAAPPAQLRFSLPDLASRCAAAMLLLLRPLDEADQRAALQLRARARGLELPEGTARYLQRRFPRDLPTLCGLLDAIDSAALQAQRRLTVPFIRAVLGPHLPGHAG